MRIWKYILKLDSDFKQTFYVNEYAALRGYRSRTLMILTMILLMTFLAFGWAIGGMKKLQERTNDPFTNWVSLPISSDHISDHAGDLFTRYESTDLRDKLHMDTVTGWNHFWWEIHDVSFTSVKTMGGLTVVPGSKLLHVILDEDKDNVVWMDEDVHSKFESGGLIMTIDGVRRLGHDVSETKLADIKNVLINYDTLLITAPVIAVVKKLPAYCAFACTPEVYNILNVIIVQDVRCNQYLRRAKEGDTHFPFMVRETEYDEGDIKNQISEIFPDESPSLIIDSEPISTGPVNWLSGKLAFNPSKTPGLDTIHNFYRTSKVLHESMIFETGSEVCKRSNVTNFHYIAFNFDDLNKLEEFQDDLLTQFDIPIDMRQAQDKENFALVSRLTSSILIILLLFSILSIILFLSNLLKTHLNKVQQNLGTFKAFGLSTKFLTGTYAKIVLGMLAISIVVAMTFTIFLDRLEQLIMKGESNFHIFNIWILVAVFGLITLSLLVVMRSASSILKNTPGDLIYNRNKSIS